MPAIMSWPARIPAGQVIDEIGAAFDIPATFLTLAGGDPSRHELDGLDITRMVTERAPTPHDRIFWEMGAQTAVRRGRWKLVLNGQLLEGAAPEDDVFLADVVADMGERTNLAGQRPEVVAELRAAAGEWRARIEDRWTREWQPKLGDLDVIAAEAAAERGLT